MVRVPHCSALLSPNRCYYSAFIIPLMMTEADIYDQEKTVSSVDGGYPHVGKECVPLHHAKYQLGMNQWPAWTQELEQKTLRRIHGINLSDLDLDKMSDKGLICRLYIELPEPSNNRKTNNLTSKWAKDKEETVLQRKCTDGQQTHEKVPSLTRQ